MAAPVITSALTYETPTRLSVHYRITATNFPTSFDATGLPVNMEVSTTTGKLGGPVRSPGVYSVTISATNADGTGTATLVITATDAGGTGTGTGVTVTQSKWWADEDERIDYADLDDAGHIVAEFDSDSIGSDQLGTDALYNKVYYTGGPGRAGAIVLDKDLTFVSGARASQLIGKMQIPGVMQGDVVVVGDVIYGDGTTPDYASLNTTFFGVASSLATVSIYGFKYGPATLPSGSRINFRVFSWPNG